MVPNYDKTEKENTLLEIYFKSANEMYVNRLSNFKIRIPGSTCLGIPGFITFIIIMIYFGLYIGFNLNKEPDTRQLVFLTIYLTFFIVYSLPIIDNIKFNSNKKLKLKITSSGILIPYKVDFPDIKYFKISKKKLYIYNGIFKDEIIIFNFSLEDINNIKRVLKENNVKERYYLTQYPKKTSL